MKLKRLLNPTLIGFAVLFGFSFYGLHQSAETSEKLEKTSKESAAAAQKAEASSLRAEATVLAVRKEKNERLISACEFENKLTRDLLTDTFRNDLYFASVVSPPDQRSATEQEFINAAIALHVHQVEEAHPIRECSPKALNIPPMPQSAPVAPSATRRSAPSTSLRRAPGVSPAPTPAPATVADAKRQSSVPCEQLGKSGRCRKPKK